MFSLANNIFCKLYLTINQIYKLLQKEEPKATIIETFRRMNDQKMEFGMSSSSVIIDTTKEYLETKSNKTLECEILVWRIKMDKKATCSYEGMFQGMNSPLHCQNLGSPIT